MQLVINSILHEPKKFTANHYDFSITAEKQLILQKMKSIKDRNFKVVKKLMEMSGNFLKIKVNAYRDMRHPDSVVIVKPQQTKIKEDLLDRITSDYPSSPMTILILNTSDDTTTITHNGYIITLHYGDNALNHLFDTFAGEIKTIMKKNTDDYLLSLTREFLSTFNEENENNKLSN